MRWDHAKLAARSTHERHQLWLNAKAATGEEAKILVKLIENSGLDYLADKAKSVTLDSPIGRKLEKIVFSPDGKKAAIESTKAGLPAIAGVDPLLQAGLGEDYNPHNEATI